MSPSKGQGRRTFFSPSPFPLIPCPLFLPPCPPLPFFLPRNPFLPKAQKRGKGGKARPEGGKERKKRKGGERDRKAIFNLFSSFLGVSPVVSKRCRLSPPRYYTIPRPLQEYRNRTKKTCLKEKAAHPYFWTGGGAPPRFPHSDNFIFLDVVRTLLSFPGLLPRHKMETSED